MLKLIKSKYYKKSLSMLIIAAILPTVIIAAGSYYIGTSQIKEQVETSQKLRIQQTSKYIEEQFNSMEQVIVKWSFNGVFPKAMNSADLNLEYDVSNDLYNVLTIMRNSHSLINGVLFYTNKGNRVFTDQLGLTPVPEDNLVKLKELASNGKDFYYVNGTLPEVLQDSNAIDTFVVSKIHTYRQTVDGIIMVTLSKRSMDSLLMEMNSYMGGFSFLIKQNDSIYSPNEGLDSNKLNLLNMIKDEVKKQNKDTGSFNYSINGETYSVAFDSYDINGWKYVSVVPLSKMFAPAKKISQLLLLVSFMAFIALLSISSFLSRKIYKPVGQLTEYMKHGIAGLEAGKPEEDEFSYIRSSVKQINDERQEQKGYIEKNRVILRNGFLLQLLQKHLYNYTEEELGEAMSRMGWKLSGQAYAAVFFKLFLPATDKANFSHGDEQLATYAAANIIEEIGEGFSGVLGVVNFHNLSIAMLLEIKENDTYKIRKNIETQCEVILERLSGYLGMQVTTGVGVVVKEVRDLPDSLETAVNSIRYRDVNRKMEVIFSEDLMQQEENLNYPMELESEITYDIRMGMFTEAASKIDQLAARLKTQSGMEFFIQQGMLHLLGSILHVMMQTGVDINRLFSGSNLYEQLCSIKEPEEMVQWFKEKVILLYESEIQKTQEVKYNSAIGKVLKYVEENYMRELSLDICADEVGIPAKRLSVIFSKVTGVNFIDYVTDIRMSKAKELLRETDTIINEIAFMVGYQPQYFNKLFKKREGITPGEFRQTGRAKA